MKTAQANMEAMSVTDPLTELPNRQYLLTRLPNALASAKRHKHNVLLCTLDAVDFNTINTHHGLLVGDQILKQLGQRIKSGVRDSDLVLRMEGDKFAVLFENLQGDQTETADIARKMVSKLLDRLKEPYLAGHKTEAIECPVRIGYSLGQVAEDNASDIVNRSHGALETAKRQRIESCGPDA